MNPDFNVLTQYVTHYMYFADDIERFTDNYKILNIIKDI